MSSDTANVYEEASNLINSDEDFMDQMKDIKNILKNTTLPELKSQEAELLRTKIVEVLRYVMSRMEEEETEPEPEPAKESMPMQSPPPQEMLSGGKKTRKQKGGTPMNLPRITNATGITGISKDPYESITKNVDVPISLNVHRAFTAGKNSGFSSASGMPASDLNTMLPIYGSSESEVTGAQTGGSSKKNRKSKK